MNPLIKSRVSWGELLSDLEAQGVVDSIEVAHIAEYLKRREQDLGEPWFVQALLAIGAWIAAAFFLAFLGIADLLDDTPMSLVCWGTGLLLAAVCLRNATRHIFFVQLALALSAMAHGCLLFAVNLQFPDDQGASLAVTAAVLCIALYPLYRDPIHRFLSCLLASAWLTAWIARADVADLIHVLILAKVVLIGIVFLYRTDWTALRPLGYAMAFSVPANLFWVALSDEVQTPSWPANVVLTAVLIWLYRWIAPAEWSWKQEPLLVAVVATLALATVTTPGVLAGTGLMVLGYARRDAVLLAIGMAFFPIFIVVFYYELETTLLVKSWIMAATGGVLLATRWYLSRRTWAIED